MADDVRLAIELAAALSETDPETSDVPFLLVALVLTSSVACWLCMLRRGCAAMATTSSHWLRRALGSRPRREEKEALVSSRRALRGDRPHLSINLEQTVSEISEI